MIDGVGGDPSSCSQLGGDLLTRAAALMSAAALVADARPRRSGSAAGPAAGRDLRLAETLVDRLDSAGAALQRFAQELSEQTEELRRLEADLASAGLVLDGLRVVEPWGPAAVDVAARRRAELPVLAARAERLASRVGRSRAHLQRALTESTGILTRAAAAARESLGRAAGPPS
ncbi:MAG: hypothetical protein ABI083_08435 [Lapillicoccus sp.]